MTQRLDTLLRSAVAQGILPAQVLGESATSLQQERPWPVVLLTALGAWLAAIPLLGLFALFVGNWLEHGPGAYVIGGVLLGTAVAVLRNRQLPVFLEQLALPAMLTGAGLLGFGLARDLPPQVAAGLGLALALACAVAIDRAWLRVLLGATCALLFAVTVWPHGAPGTWYSGMLPWAVLHATLALWLGMLAWQRHASGRFAHSVALPLALEAFATGWLLQILAILAALSGMSFMLGGVLGHGLPSDLIHHVAPRSFTTVLMQAGSVTLALTAAYVAQRAWPAFRQPGAAVVALVLAGFCFFLPWLGAALLAMAVTGTTQRWRQASASALAAAWIVGSFYYRLDWQLSTKALVLTGSGAVLGALAWMSRSNSTSVSNAGKAIDDNVPTSNVASPGARWAPWLILLTAAATLAAANLGIVQKERTIAEGRKVYVELAPVDPRSLMQGDYMQLNFRLPSDGDLPVVAAATTSGRPYAIGKLDDRGVVQWLRMGSAEEALAPTEQRFQLTPRKGRWTLVTDAWYFREGDGQRWEQARYGEFRVEPDGRALLVGMADAQLRAIHP